MPIHTSMKLMATFLVTSMCVTMSWFVSTMKSFFQKLRLRQRPLLKAKESAQLQTLEDGSHTVTGQIYCKFDWCSHTFSFEECFPTAVTEVLTFSLSKSPWCDAISGNSVLSMTCSTFSSFVQAKITDSIFFNISYPGCWNLFSRVLITESIASKYIALPIFLYSIEVWMPPYVKHQLVLERVMKYAVRLITNNFRIAHCWKMSAGSHYINWWQNED